MKILGIAITTSLLLLSSQMNAVAADLDSINYDRLAIQSISDVPTLVSLDGGKSQALVSADSQKIGDFALVQNQHDEAAIADLSMLNSSGEFNAVSVSSGSSVEITWTARNFKHASVYRDHVLLEENNDGYFVDSVTSGASDSISYEIVGFDENTVTTQSRPFSVAQISVTAPTAPVTSSTIMSLALAPLPTTTWFRYQAFIAEAYTPVPALGCSASATRYAYFEGDNHGFSATATPNRVLVNSSITWATKAFSTSTQIGQTVAWVIPPTGTKTWLDSNTAPLSSAQMTLNSAPSTNWVSMHLSVDSKNPLCDWAGVRSIHALADVDIYRSGSYIISGEVRNFPSHLFSIHSSNTSSWTTALTISQTSSYCLAITNPDTCIVPIKTSGSYF